LTDARLLDESADVKQEDGSIWLLLRPSKASLASFIRPIDERDLRSIEIPTPFIQPGKGTTLLVSHIEASLSNHEWRKLLLSLVKGPCGGCVILTSEIDPLYYLTQRVREKSAYVNSLSADDKENRAAADKECCDLRDEVTNWASALRGVRKIRQLTPTFAAGSAAKIDPILRARVIRECGATEPLMEIGSRLLARSDLDAYSWDEIVGFVLDAAEPYYRSLWEVCSQEERLVLVQLAQVGLVNPKREDVVRRLGRRRLIKLDPRFRLMSDSFEQFVCAAEPTERVTEWERASSRLSWSRLGTPLYALAGMIVAVLLFAEQGVVSQLLAVATGSATTLGSLRSLYASMTKATGGVSKPA
jgi:hypothetical protein